VKGEGNGSRTGSYCRCLDGSVVGEESFGWLGFEVDEEKGKGRLR
jgi:hypothetical protein